MMETLTFAQCLEKLMQKHQLSLSSLATMIGSRADLRHILTDDGTANKRALLFEKLRTSQLFDDEDYQQLSLSLEISRLGVERYRFQQAISNILSGMPNGTPQEITTDSGQLLAQRLSAVENAESIEIICFNSCFHSLFNTLSALFRNKNQNIVLRHYVHSNANWNTAAEYVAVVMPVLFDERYQPFLSGDSPNSNVPCLSGNLLIVRAILQNEPTEMLFALADQQTAYEVPNASASHIFAFVSKVLKNAKPQPVPIKEESPYKLDFPSLCMTFLSHELNRSTYSITNDLCFQQTPTSIATDAFRDKGISSDEETTKIISRTLSIHEQRYQNQYRKKKPTYHIMTLLGCKRFLSTGMSTDHFVGFRPFTPEERKIIFENMLKAARQNHNFIPLILKDADFDHRFNLVCYDKLGVSIDAKDTDYDISKGYRSVFLIFPEFTKQYMEYYLNILVGEKCYSRQKSIEMLEELYQAFLSEHNFI